MKLFGLVSGCVLFPACVSLGTAQGLDWQVTIYEGAAQEGASFVNQPGNLEECKRARLSLGATTPWYGDFKSSAYDRDQLFWQAGQATGLVGISVTLFEVDPVLSSAPPDLYPNRLGTMWSGALVWTLQFTKPAPGNPDPDLFVVTHSPDPVFIDYQGFSYVLSSSLDRNVGALLGDGGFGAEVAVPYLQLTAVPETSTMGLFSSLLLLAFALVHTRAKARA